MKEKSITRNMRGILALFVAVMICLSLFPGEALADGSQKGLQAVKEKGKTEYYYYKGDGSKATSQWKTISGKRYWFDAKGKAVIGSAKIKGQWYVFGEKATLLKSKKKKSFYKVRGRLYYVNQKGRPLPGWKYIGGKVYYVKKSGQCAKNTTVDGVKFNGKSQAKITNQGRAKIEARKFIRKHTKKSWSKKKKFQACFRHIIAYNKFMPGHKPKGFYQGNWQYNAAVYMFTHNLRGSCYDIASAVAAVANELGYNPTVLLVEGGGHAFVKAKGRYYDNMYGAKFASTARRHGKAIQTFRFHDGKRWPSAKKTKSKKKAKKKTTTKKRVGSVKINGKYYIYKANGKLCKPKKTKVVTIKGKKYRVKKNGRAAPGWTKNKKRCFASTGEMYTGIVAIKKTIYAFSKSGVYDKNKTGKLQKAAKYEASVDELQGLLGEPKKKKYKVSCYGKLDPITDEAVEWKDGAWTYEKIIVNTVKSPSGAELIMGVESRGGK